MSMAMVLSLMRKVQGLMRCANSAVKSAVIVGVSEAEKTLIEVTVTTSSSDRTVTLIEINSCFSSAG